MVPTRPRLSSVAMAPSRNPRDTRALGRAGGRARAGGQSRGCLRPVVPGKETESGRARAGQVVVRCVSHPLQFPSPSLRFPLPRQPEREGETPFWGRCLPVTRGGGFAHREGLAGNWKVKLCEELEREALVGVWGRCSGSRAVRAAQRSIARLRPQERHGPQRPALPSPRRAGTDPEQCPAGRWRVRGRNLTPDTPEVEREVKVPRGMQGRRAGCGAGTGRSATPLPVYSEISSQGCLNTSLFALGVCLGP